MKLTYIFFILIFCFVNATPQFKANKELVSSVTNDLKNIANNYMKTNNLQYLGKSFIFLFIKSSKDPNFDKTYTYLSNMQGDTLVFTNIGYSNVYETQIMMTQFTNDAYYSQFFKTKQEIKSSIIYNFNDLLDINFSENNIDIEIIHF